MPHSTISNRLQGIGHLALLCVILLVVTACTTLTSGTASTVQPSASNAIPTSGRVPGAPVRKTTPVPEGDAMQGVRGVTTAIVYGLEGLVIDVYSETGIGSTGLALPMVAEATPVALRLHLRGLEGWRFDFATISIIGAVSTTNGTVSEQVQIGDASATPIDASSPYWMEVTHIAGEDASAGYYELTLPSAFLESGLNTFTLSFVDYYR